TVNELLMQFQSDVLGIEVQRPKIMETTALGAAYAAARAENLWPEKPSIQSQTGGKTWRPKMDPATRDKLYNLWLAAVQRSLDWVPPAGSRGSGFCSSPRRTLASHFPSHRYSGERAGRGAMCSRAPTEVRMQLAPLPGVPVRGRKARIIRAGRSPRRYSPPP